MKRLAQQKVNRFLECFTPEDRVLIVINADPDAIASAMAVKRLLWRRVAAIVITHVNRIDRPDNQTMIQTLGVKLVGFEHVDVASFSRTVMVDSQPSHHPDFARIKRFNAVIDHHPQTEFDADFQDIRPGYGATSSIMTEYLFAAKIKLSARLASGLLYAIKTDTHNFERQAVQEDLRAFQLLYKHANLPLLRKIESAEFKPEYLRYFRYALQTFRLRHEKIYVHLGEVVHPDVCVMIADFFMKVQSVAWTVVSGICKDKLTVVFRNDGIRKNAGSLAQKAFGAFGSAGGHKSMARAELPMDNVEALIERPTDTRIIRWIVERVEGKSKS
ncbi:DHH family phosphoesterase [Desulfatirhabdium butyrativorans]|uniref:DHH family phosphoesterase n=1 Tax=Desulfatirhabdium butyrativorans TaxID=340467 RepID=UPI0003FB9E65|nr:DHH family phosphoesterase [Desulfatirhabdium butyrativorans]